MRMSVRDEKLRLVGGESDAAWGFDAGVDRRFFAIGIDQPNLAGGWLGDVGVAVMSDSDIAAVDTARDRLYPFFPLDVVGQYLTGLRGDGVQPAVRPERLAEL